ncbi:MULTISPECIES: ChrR family anti-sigma-E factor [Mameliella]|uniref:ChrR family anti-sigma-E factor n=1 Tax=Mameliella TaxID=1434019 RepID=UPI000B533E07|nr:MULTISPECIES: ChrR family anti-sigma-E factor [Mameliella]MCR9275182.1 ChrR family anti-sigma-E factor [Paracoccaceae bacterium]OWV52362.1 transcriptional regulator [Mameliella alba]
MTTIRHHLTDDLIMGYSAGTLPEAVNLIIATHVSLCDDCRAAVEAHDALGGAVLDATEAETLDESCLDATLAMIRAMDAPTPRDIAMPRDAIAPAPLLDYIGGSLEAVKWRPVGMGVKQAILKTSPEATARLLYIPAGTAMPDHGHRGLELTLVLQGAFQDDEGYFARGDIEIADAELHHTPVADISQDCICLAVTDAPLRLKGLARLAQPFLNI